MAGSIASPTGRIHEGPPPERLTAVSAARHGGGYPPENT